MSRDCYYEINLHMVWHTKDSSPTLTPNVEAVAHQSLLDRVLHTSGVIFHEVGGTENHVYLAVSISPTLLISRFIGELKGGSSHAVNQMFPALTERFAWQVGYGVVSFATRHLSWVVDYIRNQKEHHASGKDLIDRLERTDPEPD
jgi:putative transposase